MELFMKLQGHDCLMNIRSLNGCETGKCQVTSGYTLPANYVFHTLRLRDENDYKLSDCYKSCLQKVLAFNVKSIDFAMEQLVFLGFAKRILLKWH